MKAYDALRNRPFARCDITLRTKTQVYETTILTVLLYAMECVTLYSRHIKALTRVQLRDLRQLQRIGSQDRVLDLEVLKRERTNSVEAIITHAQLPWAGHVRRLDDNRLPKVVIYGELRIGKRKQGGQKLRYKDVISGHLKRTQII